MKTFKPSSHHGESFMSLPETYLKTQQVADALGVSVSSIKRWVDAGVIEATRTMGRHRLVLLSSALSFARREKFPVEDLLSLAGSGPTAIDEACDLLVDALKRGRPGEASALIASAHRAGGGAVALADRVIRPVMERVGHAWMVGAWDVYHEHQATQIVASALADLVARARRPGNPTLPLALASAPDGDPYTLVGLLGELVLREGGWDVRNLGGNLPLRSLAAATREYRPRLIFLSASFIADREGFLRDYAYFYEAATQVDAAVILGGRALDPDLRTRLVYASFGDRMAHLAEFARRVLPPAGPPSLPASSMDNLD